MEDDKKQVVYVLQEQQVSYGDEYHQIWVFDSKEKAEAKLKERVEKFKESQKDWGELYVEDSSICFECYEEGYYLQEHYWIVIDEREVL